MYIPRGTNIIIDISPQGVGPSYLMYLPRGVRWHTFPPLPLPVWATRTKKKKITTLLEVISNIVIYIFIHILKEDTSRNKKRKKKKWYIFSFHALVGNFTSSYYEDITSSKDMRSFWVMFVLLCFNLLSVINDPSLLDSQVIVYIYISVYTLLHQELTIDPTWLVTSTVLKSSFYVNA